MKQSLISLLITLTMMASVWAQSVTGSSSGSAMPEATITTSGKTKLGKRAKYTVASLPTCNATTENISVDVTDGNRGSRTCKQVNTGVYRWVDPNVFFNIYDFGAVCDGTTNDTTGINAAIAAAVANNGGEVIFPGGKTCRANVVITEARGIKLRSVGSRYGTIIQAVGANPALKINGLWYSQIEGLSLWADSSPGSNIGAMEIDGNYDGTHTLRVQGNSFKDLFIDGRSVADVGITLCRQGGSSGQCSENRFDNVHVNNVEKDAINQYGYNALANLYIGGNWQNFKRHGIRFVAGGGTIIGTGIQCTNGYTQILNDGYDINANEGGVNDKIVVVGVRSESLRVIRGGFSQWIVPVGIDHRPVGLAWTANTAFSLNAVVVKFSPNSKEQLYRVTTAGTSGSSEPLWPNSGMVRDGSVVWTQSAVTAINIPAGEWNDRVNTVGFDDSVLAKRPQYLAVRELQADHTIGKGDSYLLVDATGGNRTITFDSTSAPTTPSHGGQIVYIRRYDSSTNTVTVSGVTTTGTGTTSITIPAGGWAAFAYNGGGNLTGRWFQVGGNLLNTITANVGTSIKSPRLTLTDTGTATASAGAATLNSQVGTITSESLKIAAGASYTLTLTNSLITSSSRIFVSFSNGTNSAGTLALGEVTPGNGNATIVIRNIHASNALNGTIKINFFVL